MSQRRSYQARQKIAKMKKVYKAAKEEVSKDKAHGIFGIQNRTARSLEVYQYVLKVNQVPGF